MSWFHPCSLEPLYKLELLGLLTSLAVYNGLTLPFSFPLAFYRNLLGLPNTEIDDISDGWARLASGLEKLRDWPEDNVEEVFSRPFVFSIDMFGVSADVDMNKAHGEIARQKKGFGRQNEQHGRKKVSVGAIETAMSRMAVLHQPAKRKLYGAQSRLTQQGDDCAGSKRDEDSPLKSVDVGERATNPGLNQDQHPTSDTSEPPSDSLTDSEPAMVTNKNRERYIREYIGYLTNHTIIDQREAFEAGFFTCINRKSISLFSPTQLKYIVEGLPDINVGLLEKVTKYEGGFHSEQVTIRYFWAVVHRWSQEKVRQLLEFVTASDRLPAGGEGRLTFVIQKNGEGNGERLPTSLTCFGTLLLPEYTVEKTLREGLELAIEHSKGFGQP